MAIEIDAKRARASLCVCALSCALAGAAPAQASNIRHPRTPVVWPEAPCIQSVEAQPGSSFGFDYSIPFEDTQTTFDELEDSRTHQFLAFCRQWPAGEPPPPYVSVADLQRALDAQLETDPELLDDPEATLETSVEWAGCWTRITADDARRPITESAAAEPVQWSLDGVTPGTWMLAGYTWEPPLNLWSRAPGVVRVTAPEHPGPPAPAAAMGLTPEGLPLASSLDVPVCVAAQPEDWVHLEWTVAKDDPRVWTTLDTLAVGEADTLDFILPSSEPYIGATLLLRARVESPSAADYVSHGLVRVNVQSPGIGEEDTGDDTTTGAEDEAGNDSESGETSSMDTGSTGGAAEDAASGCRLDRPAPFAPLLLVLPFLARRRRARRSLTESTS